MAPIGGGVTVERSYRTGFIPRYRMDCGIKSASRSRSWLSSSRATRRGSESSGTSTTRRSSPDSTKHEPGNEALLLPGDDIVDHSLKTKDGSFPFKQQKAATMRSLPLGV